MANAIQLIREETEKRLQNAIERSDMRSTEISPCGRYSLTVSYYASGDRPEHVCLSMATVCDSLTGRIIAKLSRNYGSCFYTWITRDGHDYFIFTEDLEGQTVVDLTHGKTSSYSSPDDPFIWAEFHPSPDSTKLAIIGCYWGCPYQITVYDFMVPLELPLPVIASYDLVNNDDKFAKWLTNDSLSITIDGADSIVYDLPV